MFVLQKTFKLLAFQYFDFEGYSRNKRVVSLKFGIYVFVHYQMLDMCINARTMVTKIVTHQYETKTALFGVLISSAVNREIGSNQRQQNWYLVPSILSTQH